MPREIAETRLLKSITNSRIWQVGLEGILEEKVTKNMNNETLARATKWGIRVFTSAALAATAWGCKNGWIPVESTSIPTTTTENVPPAEASIARGMLNEVADQIEKTAIIDSLPEDRPQAKHGNEGMDVFKIDTENTSSKFVMYELTDEEVQNGIAVILNGQTVIQNVALYTERKDSEGNKSWVRLIAVTVPSGEGGDGKSVVWVYDEKGFPTQGDQEVNLNRPVLSYPIPNTTGRVLFSPLLPANPNPIIGWDGFNPFYVDIQGNIPGTLKVSANIAHVEVPTPEATATPEYPVIPQEIMDQLPEQWEVLQTGNTWYIVDQSTNSNIYRFPEAAEKWQERHDVTVGETTYEGWIKDQGQKEVTTGEATWMDKLRVSTDNEYSTTNLSIAPGYVTSYQVIEITDGQNKMNLLDFTMRYFYKEGDFQDIRFLGNQKLVESKITAKQALGKRYWLRVATPIKTSFTEKFISKASESINLNPLEKVVMFSGEKWVNIEMLVSQLQNPNNSLLDLANKLLVEDWLNQ